MFLLEADKDTKLYIGDKQLIQWNGSYQSRVKSFMVPLKKGFYPIRIEYLHHIEDFKLRMTYLTPGTMSTMNPHPIPMALQYSEDKKRSVK